MNVHIARDTVRIRRGWKTDQIVELYVAKYAFVIALSMILQFEC